MAERQFQTKVKSIQSDWGGEFRCLTQFFTSLSIIQRRSCPHTSEQNETVERQHRHVVETGLTLLAQYHLPQQFWHFAFETAVYLINRLPSRVYSNKYPFEHIFKRKPDYSFFRVFGCQCFPYLRPYNNHKIDIRSTPCVFLGYSPAHHGYRCFDPNIERIYIVRHVRFNEHVFPYHKSPPTPTPSQLEQSCVSIFPEPPPFIPADPIEPSSTLQPSQSDLPFPTEPTPTTPTTSTHNHTTTTATDSTHLTLCTRLPVQSQILHSKLVPLIYAQIPNSLPFTTRLPIIPSP
ncbi:hypothetical protein E3N88_46290 [Mikania micrantha]|uniref:Integrase catalytic domain-containing protein n=1 Tax=Mikania micrantha TaxID=192012 RepID=A0A5N6L6N1_9ASTR|nr:hypothetical protein E3N88_46290 [Mikania micrantha]